MTIAHFAMSQFPEGTVMSVHKDVYIESTIWTIEMSEGPEAQDDDLARE